eukprot:m51a1_g2281 hypothetical protein (158) ;mRNA; r:385563-386135
MSDRCQEIAHMLNEGLAYAETLKMTYTTLADTIKGPNAPVVSYLFKKWAKKNEKYSNRVRCFTSRALGQQPEIAMKDPKELGVYQTDKVEEAVSQMLACEKKGLECVKHIYQTICECREDPALNKSFHLAEHLGRHVLMQKELHVVWLSSLASESDQ